MMNLNISLLSVLLDKIQAELDAEEKACRNSPFPRIRLSKNTGAFTARKREPITKALSAILKEKGSEHFCCSNTGARVGANSFAKLSKISATNYWVTEKLWTNAIRVANLNRQK